MLKISQYPRNADGNAMDLEVGMLTDTSGNGGARLTQNPVGPDGAPIDAKALVLVNASGDLVQPTTIDDVTPESDTAAGTFTRSAAKIASLISSSLTGINNAVGNLITLFTHTPINPAWYGLVEGDNAANAGPNAAAINTMFAAMTVSKRYRVSFPPGTFWIGDTTGGNNIALNVSLGNIIIKGAASAGTDETSALIRTPLGVTGIVIQNDQSSGLRTKDGAVHSSGGGTVVRNLSFQGSFAGVEGETHGGVMRRRATFENVTFKNYEGEGLLIAADLAAASGAYPPYGNDNASHNSRITVFNCRNGVKYEGQDSNGGVSVMVNVNACRQWGVWDASGFGNTFLGGQLGTNGITNYNDGVTIGASVVTYSGNWYGAIVGQEAWCAVNAPSGTAADNQGWYYMGAGAVIVGKPAWFNGILVRAGGVARSHGAVCASHFAGVYADGDQGKAYLPSPALVSGGTLASWCYGGPIIKGALDVTTTGPAVHVEPTLKVVSGSVTVSLGRTSGNAANDVIDFRHPTSAPAGYQYNFSAALSANGDYRLTYNAGAANPFWVTGPNTAVQFGTGAAVPHAFCSPKLYLADNAGAVPNARHVCLDTVVPAAGAHGDGEFVFYRGATVGLIGFSCKAAGTPGTWEPEYAAPLNDDNMEFHLNISGAFLSTQAICNATAVAGVADRYQTHPWTPSADTTIQQIGVEVTTLLAASNARVVVHDTDPVTRGPNNVLFETGNLSCAAVGYASEPRAFTFKKGVTYWMSVRTSSTQSLRAYTSTAARNIGQAVGTGQAQNALQKTLAFATAAPAWGAPTTAQMVGGSPLAVIMQLA